MKKVLFVQTAFIGDVLLGVPALKRIHELWPNVKLDVIVRKGLASLVKSTGLADQVFEVNKGDSQSYSKLRSTLLKQDYDLVLCPHRSLRSALLIRGVGQTTVGVKSFWNRFFFSKRIDHHSELPEPIRQLEILSFFDSKISQEVNTYTQALAFGAGGLPIIPPSISAILPKYVNLKIQSTELSEPVRKFLDAHQLKNFFILTPGSVWSTKKWGKENFLELARSLIQQNFQVVLTGSKEEKELCQYVAEGSGAINSAGLFSLPESLELMTQSLALVCNDSGTAHMAATFELPTVSVFGPTVQRFGYRPWNNSATIVENKDLSCRPCAKHGGHVCPLGTHECMKSISSTEVETKLKQLLFLGST